MKYDLSGEWKLLLDSEKAGIQNGFFKTADYNQTIELPGTVSQQKKSPETSQRSTGYLTDPYKYEGWAWFEKTIKELPYGKYRLILERTRVSTVWINGKQIGTNNSLVAKHFYDFEYSSSDSLKITVLISNVDYLIPGGHMTSPDTQTNWIGITGEITLEKLENSRLENTTLGYELYNNEKILNIETEFLGIEKTDVEVEIENLISKKFVLENGKNLLKLSLPENTVLWSHENPKLYKINLHLGNNTYSYNYGFREFKAVEKHFEINGNKVFLIGKHDGMIFPETGFAPTDVESWLKVLKTAKDYGFNHYRFHTCCPPEAAFIAADQIGIYMAPELPFWGTVNAPDEPEFKKESTEYLINEGYKILQNFSNHPSFVMMSLGNELWGSENYLDKIISMYKQVYPDILYTLGSNNFQFWPRTTPNEDYFVGVRFSKEALIRGSYAMCDAPLGFVQTDKPNTDHNYDVFFKTEEETASSSAKEEEIEIQFGTGVKKVKSSANACHFVPNKPCISHEVGQYCAYPNFEENKRFTGVLKPYNFEAFENRLKEKNMLSQATDFFRDSSALMVQCYKTEIEAALRSNELSGFQLLDLQDFTGQGTAVVGILNAFMESKGIVESAQWKSFCNDTVLLASFDKYVYEENECLRVSVIFHNYSQKDFTNQFITAYIIDTDSDEILCEESFEIKENYSGNQELGVFTYKFENIDSYKKYAFLLILQDEQEEDKSFVNSYMLHAYPKPESETSGILNKLKTLDQVEAGDILITKNSITAKNESKNYRKIILLSEKVDSNLPGFTSNDKISTVEGTYCTDFWCYPMFRSISESMNKPVPTGTLGLTIDKNSELLKGFPTDSYTTPKWYNIITHGTCINLEGKEIQPVVQMIDNFERNWKLGLLYQTENIVVCTSRLWEISEEPEVALFLKSLMN